MKIAMVLSREHEIIVPIVEGTVIRLYDSTTGDVQDYENPALRLQSGKRGAVIKWLNESGVTILCAPPKMLCDLSYKAAQKEDFQYYRISSGTSFSDLKKFITNNLLEITNELPEKEIEPSFVPKVD